MRIYLKRLQPLRDILELRSTRRRTKDDQRGQASTRYEMRTVFYVNAPLAIVKLLKPVPVLQRSLQIADQLGQHDVIIVLDQAIYAKALEVLWQNKDQFQRLVVRLGSFHTICAFFAAIGKQFGDAGLADVLMESGIVASGSVAGVIEGHHYNRAVRTHKVDTV